MSDSSTAAATGNSGSIEAATQAFEQILSGKSQDTEETNEAQQADDEDEDEEQAEASSESEGDEEGEESDEEAEEADDEDESDEDEQTEEPEANPTYTVKIDGKEVEVPLDELVKGYSRTADYTRKTQEVAAIRKAAEAEVVQSRELRETYAQRLAAVEQLLQESQPQEPNWEHLRATDPIEFAAQWADFQRRQQAAAMVQAERAALEQQRERDEAMRMQADLQRGHQALMEAIPEWKDPKVAKAERDKLKEIGRRAGYSDAELSQVTDPRAVILLRKAMLYEAMVEKRGQIKPTPKKAATPTLKPGTQSTTTARKTSEVTRAKQRLAKTGSTRDAAEVFKFLL